MNQLVKNITKSSTFYNLEGLVVLETDKTYIVIWFKVHDLKSKPKGVMYIKERPFITSTVRKSSVKLIHQSELSIPNPNIAIQMARVQATHLTGGSFRPKTLPKAWQKGLINNYKDMDEKLLIYK